MFSQGANVVDLVCVIRPEIVGMKQDLLHSLRERSAEENERGNEEYAKARVTVPETEPLLQLSHTGLLCMRTKRLACSGHMLEKRRVSSAHVQVRRSILDQHELRDNDSQYKMRTNSTDSGISERS